MMYFSKVLNEFVDALQKISEMDKEVFERDEKPLYPATVEYAYISHNRDAQCKLISYIPSNHDLIFAIKWTEPLSDQYLRNLNVISPYRYRITEYTNRPVSRNVFIDWDFVGKPIKEISSDSGVAKHYINNVLSMTINLIAGLAPDLEVDHRNMFGIMATTVSCNKLGLALTPEFLADALGTNRTIAEQVIEKFDYETNEFIGLPWYI